MTDRFVTPEEIARFEMRVMSVGHGVLSDSEWRRLIDTLEYAQAEARRRSDVMAQWWEDHKRITDELRGKLVDAEHAASRLRAERVKSCEGRAEERIQEITGEATRRRNERARYTSDDYDRGAFNEAEAMLAWLEDRAAHARHWEDRDEWVTEYD